MSSNSLISSLFRDNFCSSRSSSLFNKNLGQQPALDPRPRSQSAARNKNMDEDLTNRSHPLAKMAHIFSVKIKKYNYFLFCRLEANLKKLRQEKTKSDKLAALNKIAQQTAFSQKKIISQKVVQGVENLAETLLLINSKKNQCNNLPLAFQNIIMKSKKVDSAHKIQHQLYKISANRLKDGFKRIVYMEKISLKLDIFQDAYCNIIVSRLKGSFSLIRDQAIEKMIQQEEIQRQQLSKVKFAANTQLLHNPKFNNLKEISEQDSEIISEQETARFIQNQEDVKNSEDYTFRYLKKGAVDAALTPRKESRRETPKKDLRKDKNLSHSKKQRIFMDEEESDFSNQNNCTSKCDSEKKKLANRQTTKIQPRKQPISFAKALKIKTSLVDEKIIIFDESSVVNRDTMTKSKNLYPENIVQTVADHDNITFFQHIGTRSNTMTTQEDGALSGRGSHFSVAKNSYPEVQEFDSEMTSEFGTKNENDEADQQMLNSPKFKEETNNYVSTPLTKIEEMMLDLERMTQGKSNSKKYTTGYHKCKISVHLPRRNVESNNNSGSKYSSSSYKLKNGDWRSEKKNRKEGSQRVQPWSIKDPKEGKDSKQNVEVKLWEEKEKFFFYPESAGKGKEMKKNTAGYISSMDQSLMNSARKTTTMMKKEIESIKKNSSKSRTSLGNLKIVRNKAHN